MFIKINIKQRISIYIFYFLSIIAIAYGLMYLFKNDIMSYNYAFLKMDKTQITNFNPRIIKLMLVLMKVSGACFVAVGSTALIITARFLKKGERWTLWCLISIFSFKYRQPHTFRWNKTSLVAYFSNDNFINCCNTIFT